MKISISELRRNILNLLQEKFTEEESNRIADYLIWADMSGNTTQGLIKLTGTEPLQNIEPQHEIRIERDTKLSQLINAGANPAPLVSGIATDVVIAKAKEHGFGLVGVHNYFSSNGAQAYYAERIARENLIGIVLARPPASVAPFGATERLFGTNPICFSFPTLDEPIVFDMATSAMTWYGLVLAKARGEVIPEGVAVDADGNPTTDPTVAMQGSLLPFDQSYKGSGLGMVVEILGGPLVHSAYAQLKGEWGALFMAIDPNLLVDTEEFKASCSDLAQKIRSARKKPGTDLRLPGDRAQAARKEVEATGMVEVDEVILKELHFLG